MAKENTKINYNEEEDILSLSKGRKIRASIDVGDFIIDIDTAGFVTGIEILDASKTLQLPEELLVNLIKASMNVTYKPNYIHINLLIQFKEKEKDVTIPLTVDLGHKSIINKRTEFAVA